MIYEKIEITNTTTNEKKEMMFDIPTFVKSFEYTKNYDYNELAINDAIISNYNRSFSPIEITLKTLVENSFYIPTDIKFFVQDTKSLYRLDFKKNGIDFHVYFVITSNQAELVTGNRNEFLQFSIKTVSHFLTLTEYSFEIDPWLPVATDGLDYELDYQLGGNTGNTLSEGIVEIEVNGTENAYLIVEMYGPTNNPKFGIDARWDRTTNSFASKDTILYANQSLVVNSFPLQATMTVNGVNARQNRVVVGHDTYCEIDFRKKSHKIYFTDVPKARIVIINQFRFI